mmetsp:Transcript_75799/g.180054  ORF Transcript_75799/g.180054 Transcript_75799/m.180054 type:complete len:167 (-) Transcript_75799:473-973(-)
MTIIHSTMVKRGPLHPLQVRAMAAPTYPLPVQATGDNNVRREPALAHQQEVGGGEVTTVEQQQEEGQEEGEEVAVVVGGVAPQTRAFPSATTLAVTLGMGMSTIILVTALNGETETVLVLLALVVELQERYQLDLKMGAVRRMEERDMELDGGPSPQGSVHCVAFL